MDALIDTGNNCIFIPGPWSARVGFFFARAISVLAESHIQDPMQAIFNVPVSTNSCKELDRVRRQT